MSYIRLCNKHLFLQLKTTVFSLEQRKHRHKLMRCCVSLENCSVFWPSELATRRPFLRNVKWKTLRNVKCKTLLKFTILDVAKRLILSTKTSKNMLKPKAWSNAHTATWCISLEDCYVFWASELATEGTRC